MEIVGAIIGIIIVISLIKSFAIPFLEFKDEVGVFGAIGITIGSIVLFICLAYSIINAIIVLLQFIFPKSTSIPIFVVIIILLSLIASLVFSFILRHKDQYATNISIVKKSFLALLVNIVILSTIITVIITIRSMITHLTQKQSFEYISIALEIRS
jgi:hypothetical protein